MKKSVVPPVSDIPKTVCPPDIGRKGLIHAETVMGAAVSNKFNTVGTQTVMSGPLVAGETVTVEQTHDGVVFQTCRLNAANQTLDQDHTMLTILGPGVFRVVKSETSNPVSVMIWETESES